MICCESDDNPGYTQDEIAVFPEQGLGQDPEVSCSNSVLYQGIDAGLLPSNRNFNLGVTINL